MCAIFEEGITARCLMSRQVMFWTISRISIHTNTEIFHTNIKVMKNRLDVLQMTLSRISRDKIQKIKMFKTTLVIGELSVHGNNTKLKYINC